MKSKIPFLMIPLLTAFAFAQQQKPAENGKGRAP